MLTIGILLEGLNDSILSQHGFNVPFPELLGALIYDGESAALDNYIYVCTPESLCEADSRGCKYLFCAAPSGEVIAESGQCANITVVRASVPKLVNHLNLKIRDYQDWLFSLRKSDNLQDIASIASKKCLYPIAILNSFFFQNALSFTTKPQSYFFRSLIEEKRIQSQQAKVTLDTERENSSQSCVTFYDREVRILDYPIRSNGKVIARIMAEEIPGVDHQIAREYLADFISTVRPLMEVNNSLKKLSMNAVSSLFADIIDQVLTTPAEIEERLQYVPDMVKGPVFCPVVIKFSRPESGIPYYYIAGQLERIFPGCSVASYNSGLVVIARKNQINDPLEFERDYFYELLNRFDAYTGIGSSTFFFSALRPLYIEASAAARLGQVFCEDKEERIFYFNDYYMYFYVDMCIEAAVFRHSIQNISYLCEPGLIHLMRYDAENQTHLFETLKGYLDCNCNASLCAQKLYFHRNTINSRLNQIEELLGASLDNANYIQSLGFSVKIIEYEIKYLHCNPLETSGKTSINTDWEHYSSFSEKPIK